jgi:hypothetical protein
MEGRNDWGVPDWLDAARYPSYSGASAGSAWAWQFLRRNREFRLFWLAKVSRLPTAGMSQADFDEIGWRVAGNHEARERFGLVTWPPDPRFREAQLIINRPPVVVLLADDFVAPAPRPALEQTEIAFVIDAARPLEIQTQRVHEVARNYQAFLKQNRALDVKSSRRRFDKYLLYLRLIDAEDAGVAPKRIKDVLFGDIAEEYPDDRRAAAFKAARRAAHRLRDGDYLALAAT